MDASLRSTQDVPTADKYGVTADRVRADQLFERTWRAAYPALRCRARHLAGGQPDRADDLLAGAAIKALQFIRRSPEKLTDPQVFLFVVLRHVFLDSVRRRARDDRLFEYSVDIEDDPGIADTGNDHATEQWNERREQLRLVASAMRRMPGEQQRLFVLRFLDELPYSAIAERMGINEPLARKRVQLLRTRLLAALERSAIHSPAPASFEQERADVRSGRPARPKLHSSDPPARNLYPHRSRT